MPGRVVTREQGVALAGMYNMTFQETSAKSGENVESVFNGITGDIIRSNLLESIAKSYRLKYGVGKKKGKCC